MRRQCNINTRVSAFLVVWSCLVVWLCEDAN